MVWIFCCLLLCTLFWVFFHLLILAPAYNFLTKHHYGHWASYRWGICHRDQIDVICVVKTQNVQPWKDICNLCSYDRPSCEHFHLIQRRFLDPFLCRINNTFSSPSQIHHHPFLYRPATLLSHIPSPKVILLRNVSSLNPQEHLFLLYLLFCMVERQSISKNVEYFVILLVLL